MDQDLEKKHSIVDKMTTTVHHNKNFISAKKNLPAKFFHVPRARQLCASTCSGCEMYNNRNVRDRANFNDFYRARKIIFPNIYKIPPNYKIPF